MNKAKYSILVQLIFVNQDGPQFMVEEFDFEFRMQAMAGISNLKHDGFIHHEHAEMLEELVDMVMDE